MERKDFHLGSELSFQDEHPKHNNSFVVPVVCIFSRELYFSVRNFFFLVLTRSLFLMVCPLVSRRSEKWSCRMRNPLDSEGWISILQLARHRRNTNSFDKSSRLSFTDHWHQFRTWFFMITGEHFKILCITLFPRTVVIVNRSRNTPVIISLCCC